jgi:hypothetical protein
MLAHSAGGLTAHNISFVYSKFVEREPGALFIKLLVALDVGLHF